MSEELKPCPFCGGRARIGVRDERGNERGPGYERDPRNGLRYAIEHHRLGCPVSREPGGEDYLNMTREGAAAAWNRRIERTCLIEYGPSVQGDDWATCDIVGRCSECGGRLDIDYFTRRRPSYCPGCGAKVVER